MKKWLMSLNKALRYIVVLLPLVIFGIFILTYVAFNNSILLIFAIIALAIFIVFLYFNGQVEQKIKKDSAASEKKNEQPTVKPTLQQNTTPLNITISVGKEVINHPEATVPEIDKAIETITVIDFETATYNYNSACSIGIAVLKGAEIIDKQYFLIQPPNNFYIDSNIAIHHIKPEDTKNAELFPAVWEKIKHLFKNTFVAAHNAIFDMTVLKTTLNYYGIEQPNFQYINTMAVSGYCIPTGTNVGKSLDARCEYFGITLDNHHNALCDAVAAAQLILCNLQQSHYKTVATFIRSNPSYLKNYNDVKIKPTAVVKHFNKVDVKEIAAATSVNEEKDADFDGKTFVITGEFKTMTREQALSVVVARGGTIKNSVSKKVDILVNADNRTSTKTKRAEELQTEGHNIKIINEEQFMRMLENNDAIKLN